ncbi:Alpha/Beta hydrolase protein [Dactylonectria estremocensis]|uniref:Alpha/Beta hydrolase protein n=1 Tax=Dactylonectria estremocensis TaxID=1079267 RepID=A0A9P9EX32_9HYPO|nr:Alpha/Beta hydrolase protein [Dactylonectria estremocensis]
MAYNTKEEVAALGETDPEFTKYIKKHNLQRIGDLAKIVSPTGADISAHIDTGETLEIPLRDGTTSQIRIFQPSNASAMKPLVVMIHGGGQVSIEVYGVTVMNTSYRLAPAYKFPTAAHDTWDTLKWLAGNYQSLGADPSTGFILFGASAGGNLAAVAAQKWLDEECFPALTGTSLSVPILLEQPLVPEKYKELWFSRDQNADTIVLNK